ncbi:unnamed protein product [Parnassius mnemosyne]|uniref:Peptidase M14 domain-containing protein n=1 Tax=Parnassius mnemosyne TaxID=213953 RepID=A0AAV1LMQ7_9NEOP
MTFIIFLIIVGFTNSAHSLVLNNTVDEFEPMCNISLLRNKRAYTEYTRWRPNLQTTQEFIVKVLDDDITTPKVNQIVAVNILPATKGTEKIIVGGVVVPSPTTAVTVEQQSEYTRFVPPTLMTITGGHKDLLLAQAAVTSGSKLPPYPPKVITQNEPPYPQFKFGLAPQRDESPPASPQFVARTPVLIGRKYAAITPVVFTQSTVTHLTPPTKERLTFPGTGIKPTRTSPLPDVIMPSRTTLAENDLHNFHNFEDEELQSNEMFMSRSTFSPLVGPERTHGENILSVREKIAVDTSKFIELTTEVRKMIEKEKKTKLDNENEFESSYGIVFYNDDDKDNVRSGHPNYKYKSGESVKQVNEDVISTIVTNKENIDDVPVLEESEINTGSEADYEQDTLGSNQTVVAEANFAKESSKLFQEIRHNCSLLRLRQLNFNSPRTLAEIVAQLKHWAENSPIAKLIDITAGNYTVMENPIYMMIVDDPSSGQIVTAKLTVMVIAGIQGRDHHAVSAALYVLYQLIERTEVHSDLLTKYRFWIIPVFNPDGYDYSMTFPQRREWTKNLRQTWDSSNAGRDSCAIFGLRCSIKSCYGVNLDRNFEYQWIPTEELRSEHPCGELYAGERQLSEAETLALTRFLHSQHVPLHTFIAFKEGDVLGIMYPYSHTKKARAFDHVYRQRASRAASAAYSISGRPYVAGQTSQFLPLYAGGIEDWIDGHLGIDNTYTVMMFRPTDSYNSKLVTERVVHEAYAAMDTLLLQNVEPILGPPLVTLSKSKGSYHTLPFPISSVFCISILLIVIDTQITIRT